MAGPRWTCVRTEVRDLPSYDIRVERAVFEPHGIALERVDMDDPEAFARLAPEADAVLHMRGRLDADRIALLGRCRIIAHYGTGVDRLDVDAATRRGIWVTNGPRYAVDEVSSHAIALLLAVARKIVAADRAVRAGQWHIKPIVPLHRIAGGTLGLLGFGNIARATGRKGQALGLRVIAYDPYVDPAVFVAERVERVNLDDCLARADFLSVHLPLTNETTGMLGHAAFAQMKPGALLINTSRGGVIDEAALVEALRAGHLAGAGLDVFAHEPPATDHPLLALPNVTVSGHIAFYSEESIQQMQRDAANQVVQALQGTVPEFLVNREALRVTRQSES
ncbi:MAG: C-terminal binding protein [Armatimonadota bacterium]|nr:C-terminal binding protein [Armatimonadota bacterium]